MTNKGVKKPTTKVSRSKKPSETIEMPKQAAVKTKKISKQHIRLNDFLAQNPTLWQIAWAFMWRMLVLGLLIYLFVAIFITLLANSILNIIQLINIK